MMQAVRKYQRKLAVALLLLNMSGARAITVCDACEHHRTFFSAGLGFKALTKKVMRVERKKQTGNSFGERASRFCACDLSTVRREKAVAMVVTLPAISIPLDTKSCISVPAPPPGGAAPHSSHSPQLLI
jgi:hypothetical protein